MTSLDLLDETIFLLEDLGVPNGCGGGIMGGIMNIGGVPGGSAAPH